METLRIVGLRINGFSVDCNRMDLHDDQALASKGSEQNLISPHFSGIFLDAGMRSRYCHLTPLSKG
jgi:hypothetical protein